MAFIDDNIILWNNDLGSVSILDEEYDRIHELEGIRFIKVDPTISTNQDGTITESQIFLDLEIKKIGDSIVIDQYDKSCHNFVPWNSCHPHNTRLNIPYNLALRICTLCDTDPDIHRRLEKLRGILLNLSYPANVVNDAILKARGRSQHELRNPPPKDSNDVIPFVFTYNPRNPKIFQRVIGCTSILNESAKMKAIMEQKKIVPSKRQPPNLILILTKSKFSLQATSGGVRKCNDPCCANCEYMIEGDSITVENGDIFHIKTEMTCQTANVVYVIFCRGCGKSYIDETAE